MPHIFFERLERRRSTQSLLGNIPTNGLLGPSSFAPSAPSGIAGPYGLPLSLDSSETFITCYLPIGPVFPRAYEDLLPYNIRVILREKAIMSSWPFTTKLPWLNSSYTYPSWNYLNNWPSAIQNNWQTPFNYTPSWGSTGNWTSPITNYPQTPSIPTYPWNTYMHNLSKLNNVRKDLLAFFRKKGILSDKQRQRLLSKPFEKA